MRVLLNGMDVGTLDTVNVYPRLVGEENGFACYEPAQMYIDLTSNTRIEIVREIGFKIDEQADTLAYDGPWTLVVD